MRMRTPVTRNGRDYDVSDDKFKIGKWRLVVAFLGKGYPMRMWFAWHSGCVPISKERYLFIWSWEFLA
jgi:hypothetical protein